MELSKLLLERRKLKGYTIKQLSTLANVSTGLISKLETGKCKSPSLITLKRITEILEIDSSLIMNNSRSSNLIDVLQEEGLSPNDIYKVINYIEYIKYNSYID